MARAVGVSKFDRRALCVLGGFLALRTALLLRIAAGFVDRHRAGRCLARGLAKRIGSLETGKAQGESGSARRTYAHQHHDVPPAEDFRDAWALRR